MACNARPKSQPDCSRAAQASSSVSADRIFSNDSTFCPDRAHASASARTAASLLQMKPAPKVFRARRLQPLRQLAAGQIFVHRHGLVLARATTGRPPAPWFSSSAAKYRVAQQAAHLRLHRRDHLHRLVSIGGLGGDAHVDLAGQRQHADGRDCSNWRSDGRPCRPPRSRRCR